MCSEYEQVIARVLLIWYSKENIILAHSTISITHITRVDFVTTFAAIHIHSSCHHKWIRSASYLDTTKCFSTIRYHDMCFWSPTQKNYRDRWNHSKKICIKYDASLTGLGVGLYNVSTDTLLTFAALQLPVEVNNESKRQNTMEFVAVIFGLL